jgi:GTPase SAR1 family protein
MADNCDCVVLDSEEEVFSRRIEEGIANKETIKQKLAHAMVVGPTGSGKSSLMDRLLHRILKETYTSTPVADSVVAVSIEETIENNPSTFQVVDGDSWTEVKYDESIHEQLQLPTQKKPNPHPQQASQERSEEQSLVDDSTYHHTQASPSRAEVSMVIPLVKKYGGTKKFKSVLESISLYLRDTGGQVEFQEMLPLLVFGPSLFLFVFRLDQDFNKCFRLEYRGEELLHFLHHHQTGSTPVSGQHQSHGCLSNNQHQNSHLSCIHCGHTQEESWPVS